MNAVECATRTRAPIVDVGGGFMLDPATTARGEEFGLDFGGFYVLGRGGVLGDVDADIVASAFVFFNPTLVRVIWEGARAKRAPADAGLAYAEACAEWGREHLGASAGLDEAGALLDRVVAAASPIGAPLFSGWRALPVPADPPAHVMHQLHVLRELRGGMHGAAILSVGLTPCEAQVMHRPEMAATFGWAEPLPDVATKRPLLDEAETLTNRLVAPAFAALGDAERERLADLVDGVAATVSA